MKTDLVTGGIGSGKSAVCAYLASRGVPVYDSDSRTKALYTSDPALLPALESALGISLMRPENSTGMRSLPLFLRIPMPVRPSKKLSIPLCCGIFFPGGKPVPMHLGADTGRFLSW